MRPHRSGLALVALLIAACSEAPVTPQQGLTPGAASFAQGGQGQGQGQNKNDDVMEGEIIVKLRGNADADVVAKEHGLGRGNKGYRDEFVIFHGNAGLERAQAAVLRADDRVEYAEPNYLRAPTTIDP